MPYVRILKTDLRMSPHPSLNGMGEKILAFMGRRAAG